jgi:class 3 adenylate cyclase
VATISPEELAELVPCPLEHVRRLADLGLLAPQADGRFPSSDVHVVRLMGAFEGAGIPLEDVARGVAEGQLSFPLGLFLPEPQPMAQTYEDVAAEVGCSPDLLRRLSAELGLPPAPHDRVRPEDAEMLALLMTRLDLAEDQELSRFARLYGGTVQRLVGAGLQFFDRTVRQRVGSWNLPDDERDRIVYGKAAGYTELVSRLVPWLQSRHREQNVLAYLVTVTEGFMEERGLTPPIERDPPAIAFLDLTGFSSLAEERGDEAAAEVATELAAVAQEVAQPNGGRPVKWLGDGVMFHFSHPNGAIRSGLELVEQAGETVAMPARIGIAAGALVVQEGDYFGRTVNVAARIADYAGPNDVLVSEEAKQCAGLDDVSFDLVGDVTLRGFSSAVRLHRATRRSVPPG